MNTLPAPVGAGQQRHRYLREIGRARTVPLVAQRMFLDLLVDVDAVLSQFLVGERDRAGNRFAGVGVLLRPFAAAVLHMCHLRLRPALLELRQNAAVVKRVAIVVVAPFPGNNRGQMRRVLRRHAPLVIGVVGDAQHADLAVAPRLRARPLDAKIEVVDFPR